MQAQGTHQRDGALDSMGLTPSSRQPGRTIAEWMPACCAHMLGERAPAAAGRALRLAPEGAGTHASMPPLVAG